jgi:hypothetical protein
MQRLFQCLIASTLVLGVSACEGEADKPAKTAKKDDAKGDAKKDDAKKADAKKDDAKADAKKDDAKADDAKADDAKADDAKADDAKADDAKADAPAEDGDLDGYDPRVAKAARLASQISADPQKADEMLAALDLDRDGLDDLMYEIASDPDLTAQYRMARGI